MVTFTKLGEVYSLGGKEPLKGGTAMATIYGEYKKPSMTNMPSEIGSVIITQIMNTPAPDDDDLKEQVKEFEKRVIEARKRRSAQGNTAR